MSFSSLVATHLLLKGGIGNLNWGCAFRACPSRLPCERKRRSADEARLGDGRLPGGGSHGVTRGQGICHVGGGFARPSGFGRNKGTARFGDVTKDLSPCHAAEPFARMTKDLSPCHEPLAVRAEGRRRIGPCMTNALSPCHVIGAFDWESAAARCLPAWARGAERGIGTLGRMGRRGRYTLTKGDGI